MTIIAIPMKKRRMMRVGKNADVVSKVIHKAQHVINKVGKKLRLWR